MTQIAITKQQYHSAQAYPMQSPYSHSLGGKPGAPNKITGGFKQLASEHTEEALQILLGIMRNEDASAGVRLAAVNSLLDRALGKPTVAIEVESDVKTDPDLMQKLENLYVERMNSAHERQQKVLAKRGLLN